MKRLPARIGLSGISFDCPDGSNGLLRWSEIIPKNQFILRINLLEHTKRQSLPVHFQIHSSAVISIARRLRDRQLCSEIKSGAHFHLWKATRRWDLIVLLLMYILSVPCLLFVEHFKNRPQRPLGAEVDAIMPWWYWLGMYIGSAVVFAFLVVLPLGFAYFVLRSTQSKYRAERAATDSKGLSLHLKNGKVLSLAWHDIVRFDNYFFFARIKLRDQSISFRSRDLEQFSALVRAAISVTQSKVNVIQTIGRPSVRPFNFPHQGLPTRTWWWMGAACAAISITSLFLSPWYGPDVYLRTILVTSPLVFFVFLWALANLQIRIINRDKRTRRKSRKPIVEACFES